MQVAPGNKPGDSRAIEILAPCIIFFVLTPLFVGLRLWSRIRSRSGLGWDDWTLLASVICCLLVSSLMVASCYYGFGQHIANLTTTNKLMALKLFYVAQAFYKITVNLTKASILLLYLRIFIQRWFRISCYVLLGTILAYMIGTTSSSIWQCTPVPRAWDKSIPGTCINITANWYANAGFSIISDVVILLLPMQPLYASKLPIRQKIALMGVFALGIFVTVTSILRMQTLSFSSKSPDTTYDLTSSTWTIIEDNVAIICACLPMCRGPLAVVFPSIFAPTSTKSVSYGDSNPYSATGTVGGTNSSNLGTWSELRETHEEKDAIPMTRMDCDPSADHESEEYILAPTVYTPPRYIEESHVDVDPGYPSAIHKTTEFEISYSVKSAGRI